MNKMWLVYGVCVLIGGAYEGTLYAMEAKDQPLSQLESSEECQKQLYRYTQQMKEDIAQYPQQLKMFIMAMNEVSRIVNSMHFNRQKKCARLAEWYMNQYADVQRTQEKDEMDSFEETLQSYVVRQLRKCYGPEEPDVPCGCEENMDKELDNNGLGEAIMALYMEDKELHDLLVPPMTDKVPDADDVNVDLLSAKDLFNAVLESLDTPPPAKKLKTEE